jgi:hypothetical protein
MYLPAVQYQMQYQIESRLPRFHKSHRKNMALMVVGMAYQKSVQLPQIAQGVRLGQTQVEARGQGFERVVQCEKLEVLASLAPTASRVLQQVSRGGKRRLVLVLDRSLINDKLNLLWVAVAMTLAYLWVLQIGFQVVQKGWWRQVDNRGAHRSVSLCQIGLRWLGEERQAERLPPAFTLTFEWTDDPSKTTPSQALFLKKRGFHLFLFPTRRAVAQGD